MSLPEFLLTVILISLSGVMTPGPLFAVTVAEGRIKPFSGFVISLGHATVEIPIILSLFLFGSLIISDPVKKTVSLIGGCVLIYFALNEIKCYGKGAKASNYRGLMAGILMSLFNPYFIIWWFTIGFVLILNSITFGVLGLLLFIIVHELCDFLWLGFVSYSSNKTISIWGNKANKVLSAFSISIFLIFGIYFILSAFF